MTAKLMPHILALSISAIIACTPESDPPVSLTVGYAPVYASEEDAEITLMQAQPLYNPGKIYQYGNYLFVNEVNKGIHIFDNDDPTNPKAQGFVQIYGNTEIAIKDSILYANHLGSIVALKLSREGNVKEVGRLQVQSTPHGVLPPKGYHFECIDPHKGIVVSWVASENKNMDCYALR